MRLVSSLYFLLVPLLCFSQKGTLYLKNYQIPIPNIEIAQKDVFQHPSGDIVLANDIGLILYNGTSWMHILMDDKPKVVFRSTDSETPILIGNKNSFGMLNNNLAGKVYYQNMIDTLPDELGVISIRENIENIYIQTASRLYRLSKKDKQLTTKRQEISENLVLFNHDSLLYGLADGKLFLVDGDSMIFRQTLELSGTITADIPLSKKESLLLTWEGDLFRFDGSELTPYRTSADLYLAGNHITSGIEVSETLIAVSTLTGGAVILEKYTGKAIHFINYQTGLPDDEVNKMCTDDQQGIWLCHGLGLSRIDMNLPVTDFSQFPGLAGDITCIRKMGDNMYVGTNEGLFYLDRVNDISEVSFLIKKEQKSYTDFRTFKRYKSIDKKVRITLEPEDTAQFGPLIQEIPFRVKLPYDSVVSELTHEFTDEIARKEYALQSIPYMYKKFSGLEARVNQLLFADSSLMVATNNGLFLVEGIQIHTLIYDREINYLKRSIFRREIYFAAGDQSIVLFRFADGIFHFLDEIQINYSVNSFIERQDELIIGAENKVIAVKLDSTLTFTSVLPVWESSGENTCLNITPGKLLVSSGKAIRIMDLSDEISPAFSGNMQSPEEKTGNLIFSQPEIVWVLSDSGWVDLGVISIDPTQKQYLNLFQDVRDIYIDSESDIWLAKDKGIYRIQKPKGDTQRNYRSRVVSLYDRQKQILDLEKINLTYTNNSLYIQLATPFYLGEEATKYRYKLDLTGYSWSAWNTNPEIMIQYLKPGSYSINIQSKNVFGQVYDQPSVQLTISPPFWRSWWFILTSVLLLIALVRLLILYRTKALERENRRLQKKVDEATEEILSQKDRIEKLYQDIRSSINYAKRIQQAILPKQDIIKKILPDSFLLFSPQDIVSGDFYWFHDTDEYYIIIATDCTGHGVPGALMSMIGNTLLNQIIKVEGIIDPASILYRLNTDVIASLQQKSEGSQSQDGMDLAICTYFKKKQELHFGGAMNSLYLFHEHEMQQVDADRFSVGGVFYNLKKEFNTHKIKLKSDTIAYIFSDGYADQLGGPGPKRKKYLSHRFRESLKSIYNKDFKDQKEILDNIITEWLGERDQNDDILVIGFKIEVGS